MNNLDIIEITLNFQPNWFGLEIFKVQNRFRQYHKVGINFDSIRLKLYGDIMSNIFGELILCENVRAILFIYKNLINFYNT